MEENDDFYALTFSQRDGKAPLPEVMQVEYIPQRFRQMIWRHLDIDIRSMENNILPNSQYSHYPRVGIPKIIWSFQFDIQQKPHDEIPAPKPWEDLGFCRNIILYKDYHVVLTFIEYILRHKDCSINLAHKIKKLFRASNLAYHIVEFDNFPTIVTRITREDGEATQQAIQTIREAGMDPAAAHLRQAAEHINAQQYADAIADSIHAVESVVRTIYPKARTLGRALNSLEEAGLLNRQFKQALGKLYDYTNTEQGLRHALLDKDAADVGLDEAMFMFGACASFAAYLTQKHRQAGCA